MLSLLLLLLLNNKSLVLIQIELVQLGRTKNINNVYIIRSIQFPKFYVRCKIRTTGFLSVLPLSPSLSRCLYFFFFLLLSRDLPLILTSPPKEPPIVLHSETSFCFILLFCPIPPSVPLSLSLSLSICLFAAYYMRFRAFHLCIVRTGEV